MVGRSKGKSKHSFFSRFFVILVILVSIFLIFGISREYMKRVELDKEVAELENELEKLNAKKKDFLSSIESYDSEFFIEQEARIKFDMKKPNEEVVIIPIGQIPEQQTNNLVAENNQQTKQQLNIVKWWEYFFEDKS